MTKLSSPTARLATGIGLLVMSVLLLGILFPTGSVTPTAASFEAEAVGPAGVSGNGSISLISNLDSKVYMPLVLNGGSGSPPPAGPTSTPVPPASASGGLFMDTATKTNGAKVAIDASGGVHMAYAAYGNDPTGKRPAYYAYCAANCGVEANWSGVSFSAGIDLPDNVELALTKAGHPRLLIRGDDPAIQTHYWYAACDMDCTAGANWKMASAALTNYIDLTMWDRSEFAFALDPQDHPRFVYLKGTYAGTAYAFCDATDCAISANWSETLLTTDLLEDVSLTFTSLGQPRLATVVITEGSAPLSVFYGICNTACNVAANWSYTSVFQGGGAQFVLRLDASDRPRLALYQGAPDTGPAGYLFYALCNANCNVPTNWVSTDIGLAAFAAKIPDLALDSAGHPRIAYRAETAEGLGYAWCNTGCELDGANWQHMTAEASSALEADFAPPIPSSCSSGYWYGGYRASLALDASGNPRFGYEAKHLHGNGCTVGEDFRAVRFTLFDKP